MKYNVQLNTTVESPSPEAAKQAVLKDAVDFAGEIEAIPSMLWNAVIGNSAKTIKVSVHAESVEDAIGKLNALLVGLPGWSLISGPTVSNTA
jgi:hypothetical protein